jgi:hypothetical protein
LESLTPEQHRYSGSRRGTDQDQQGRQRQGSADAIQKAKAQKVDVYVLTAKDGRFSGSGAAVYDKYKGYTGMNGTISS